MTQQDELIVIRRQYKNIANVVAVVCWLVVRKLMMQFVEKDYPERQKMQKMQNKILPKLGRPFVTGFKRDQYYKFYLSKGELISWEHLEKNVKIYYETHGAIYNRPNHIRLLLKAYDDVKVLNALFSDPDRLNQLLTIDSDN